MDTKHSTPQQPVRMELLQEFHTLMEPLKLGNIGPMYKRLEKEFAGKPELWERARELEDSLRHQAEMDKGGSQGGNPQKLLITAKKFADDHLNGDFSLAVDVVLWQTLSSLAITYADLHLRARTGGLEKEDKELLITTKKSLLDAMVKIDNSSPEKEKPCIGMKQAELALKKFTQNLEEGFMEPDVQGRMH